MYKLFTSPQCPNCKIIKHELDKNNINYQIYDINTVEGLAEYSYYTQNQSVPLLIDDNGQEITSKWLNL